MPEFLLVLLKIGAMFLMMLLGWVARRRAYITEESMRSLGRLLVAMAFPAMIFTQMLRTVDPQVLRAGWFVPLLGIAIVGLAEIVGFFALPAFTARGRRGTALFLASIPNWIYLPLPIVEGLFGSAGVRDILLYNIGAQLVLWTLGVATVRGQAPGWDSLKNLLMNPGIVCTMLGIVVAMVWPAARNLETVQPGYGNPGLLLAAMVVQALVLLGSLTIPLSLLVTGAQLGSLNLVGHRFSRDLVGVLLTRLVLAPAVTIGVVLCAERMGIQIPQVARLVGYLIACMPVAITCSIITDRYSGDTMLAARSIFYSTLISILTVPLWYYLIVRFGW